MSYDCESRLPVLRRDFLGKSVRHRNSDLVGEVSAFYTCGAGLNKENVFHVSYPLEIVGDSTPEHWHGDAFLTVPGTRTEAVPECYLHEYRVVEDNEPAPSV